MDISIINALIAGVVGLITGAIGSLIAPWIQWGVEKRRSKQARRIEFIRQWREIFLNPEFSRTDLFNHPLYGPLRELLTDKVRKELERPITQIVIDLDSPTDKQDRDIVLREIARIEKEWDLI